VGIDRLYWDAIDNIFKHLLISFLCQSPDILADEVLADDVLADDVLADDVLADDVLADDVLADDVLADDVLADDVLTDDVLADAPSPGSLPAQVEQKCMSIPCSYHC
jgi:hypothetical protein